MVLESRGGAYKQIVLETLFGKYQIRFAPVRHQVIPAASSYYHLTQNVMRIILNYTEFLRNFIAKLLWLQPTNGQFYNDPKRTCE